MCVYLCQWCGLLFGKCLAALRPSSTLSQFVCTDRSQSQNHSWQRTCQTWALQNTHTHTHTHNNNKKKDKHTDRETERERERAEVASAPKQNSVPISRLCGGIIS